VRLVSALAGSGSGQNQRGREKLENRAGEYPCENERVRTAKAGWRGCWTSRKYWCRGSQGVGERTSLEKLEMMTV